MISCAHIHPASDLAGQDLAGQDLAGQDLAGQRRYMWCCPVCRTRVKSAGIKCPGGVMMAGAALMLALAGCGHEAYEDSYPATSGVIVDGTGTTAETSVGAAGDQAAGQIPGQIPGQTSSPAAAQSGTILFMASPGDGRPPRVIARTNSITTTPTAETLAREALASQQYAASQQQAPAASLTAPLVLTADPNQTSPIILPGVPVTPRAGSFPNASSPNASSPGNSRISIWHQTGVNDGPTVLKIIETP